MGRTGNWTRRGRRCLAAGLVAVALQLAAQAGAQPVCDGNCNDDTEVTVDELMIMVNIALGSAAVGACPPGDTRCCRIRIFECQPSGRGNAGTTVTKSIELAPMPTTSHRADCCMTGRV